MTPPCKRLPTTRRDLRGAFRNFKPRGHDILEAAHGISLGRHRHGSVVSFNAEGAGAALATVATLTTLGRVVQCPA
jgi:hypothetical protein